MAEDVQAKRCDDDGRDVQTCADDHDGLEDEEHDIGHDSSVPRVDEVEDAPEERSQDDAEHTQETEETNIEPVSACVSGYELEEAAWAYEE